MRYDQLFTKLYCRPVLIQASAYIGLEHALLKHAIAFAANGEKRMGSRGIISDRQKERRMAKTIERVSKETALVHIDGVIDKHISEFEMDCYGGYDLRDFDAAISGLGRNEEIQNVMLVVNSPGGTVTGVPESAAGVAQLALEKNVFAYSDGLMCSAAYYIASQADQIFTTQSADVGSIGVYMALLDASRKLQNEGLRVDLIKSGKFKDAGAPFRSITEEERTMFQEEVNKIGEMFRGAVTSKRPDVMDDVMQGQTFFGENAVEAGLVDATVSGLNAALNEF